MSFNSYTKARYRYSNRQHSLVHCFLLLVILVLSCCHRSSAKIPYNNKLRRWIKNTKLPTFHRHKGISIHSRSILTIRGGDSSMRRQILSEDVSANVSHHGIISYGSNNKNEVTSNKQKQSCKLTPILN